MQKKEDVLQKAYLSDKVRAAVDQSESARKTFDNAVAALRDAQQERDLLLDRREEVAAQRLAAALERLAESKAKFAATGKTSEFVLSTASGAVAQLKMAKMLPFLSESRRKALESGKQNLETLRYLALARYLLGATTANGENSVEKALADSLLLDESDLSEMSDEERESSSEFKNRLMTLARRLQSNHQAYEEAIVHQQMMQMQLEQLEDATNTARQALKKADPEDVDENLQTLRQEMSNYKALQEQLQRQESVRDIESLRLEMETTALEISRLIQKQRQLALDQLLRRLSASLRAELQEKQQLDADTAAAIQDAVDAIKEQRQEGANIATRRAADAEQHIGQLEATLAEAQAAFGEAEAKLQEELPEEAAFSLWPASLQGTQKEVEEAIVGAMSKFNIAKMKLEEAKADEIDPETGKHKDCVLEDSARTLSEYQKALMHYVNDNFSVLPGVLLLWEPGTGKTQGAISACVENIRARYVEGKATGSGVDVLILGFTNDNLNDFRKTLFATMDRELKDHFELGRSGGDEEASQQSIRLKITGNDGVSRNATIVIQRYSVGASLAPAMKMHPDGIILVDEAHFMVTREVPTASTNIAQVKAAVAAWEKVLTEFDGVKLILTATPAGANRDPEMLLRLLKYMRPERGQQGKDARDAKAFQRWFKERADGLGAEWVSDEAKQEFERDWLRARISYVALRFDKRVFPQVETRCAGAKADEQCVFEVGAGGALKLAADRPRLSPTEIDARQMLEYGRMAPMLVRVPMTLEESKEFEKKSTASATSATTRNPELAECAKSDKPLAEMSDKDVAECGGFAHYAQKAGKGGQWASGGGFDIESKAHAAHEVIDSVRATSGSTRHVVIASGYENAGTRYFQTALLKEFDDFDRIEQNHVSSDEAAAKTMKKEKKRRIALLTGTTWTGSSQTKTAKQKQLIKKIFFSDANADGGIIEVLIVDASMLTGFDAKGATHLHILSPVLNQQQAWSRILRRCAQPVAKSTVYVYTYKTYIPDDVKANNTNKITITPDEMVLEALRRKREIVQPIDLLMQEMIADSYDRYWFAEYSTGGGVRAAIVGEGKVPTQPLTQQEYVLWRVFQSLVPEELKEEDMPTPPPAPLARGAKSPFGEPIGAAAAAKALGVNLKVKDEKQGRSLLLAAAAIAKRARDAAAHFFRRQKAAVERKVDILPALPKELSAPPLPLIDAPRNDIHQFAQDFFIGQPWAVADPVRFSQANISDKKAAAIVEHLVSLLQMNLLADLSLLTMFVAERLSDERREQITAMLNEKAIATPPALMRSFEDYFILQELANAHYRQVVQRAVQLAEGLATTTRDVNEAAEAIGNAPGPELPPTPTLASAAESTVSGKPPSLPPTPLKQSSSQKQSPSKSSESSPQSLQGPSPQGQSPVAAPVSNAKQSPSKSSSLSAKASSQSAKGSPQSAKASSQSAKGSPQSAKASLSASNAANASESAASIPTTPPMLPSEVDSSEWREYLRNLNFTQVAAKPSPTLVDSGGPITYPSLGDIQRATV